MASCLLQCNKPEEERFDALRDSHNEICQIVRACIDDLVNSLTAVDGIMCVGNVAQGGWALGEISCLATDLGPVTEKAVLTALLRRWASLSQ